MLEDLNLLEAVKNYGKKWAIIAKKIVGRNENGVKNRFNSLIKRETHRNSSKRSLSIHNFSKISHEKETIENLIKELKEATDDKEPEDTYPGGSYKDFSEISSQELEESFPSIDEMKDLDISPSFFSKEMQIHCEMSTFSKEMSNYPKENTLFFQGKSNFSKETQNFSKETQNFSKETQNFSKATHNFSKETQNFSKETQNFSKETQNISQKSTNLSKENSSFPPETNIFQNEITHFQTEMMDFSKNLSNFQPKMGESPNKIKPFFREDQLPSQASSQDSTPLLNMKKMMDRLNCSSNSSLEEYFTMNNEEKITSLIGNQINLLCLEGEKKTAIPFIVKKYDENFMKEERLKGTKLQFALINHEKKEIYLWEDDDAKFERKDKKSKENYNSLKQNSFDEKSKIISYGSPKSKFFNFSTSPKFALLQ